MLKDLSADTNAGAGGVRNTRASTDRVFLCMLVSVCIYVCVCVLVLGGVFVYMC